MVTVAATVSIATAAVRCYPPGCFEGVNKFI